MRKLSIVFMVIVGIAVLTSLSGCCGNEDFGLQHALSFNL